MQRPVDHTAKQPAILLLGPTGSGKTPLGDALARRFQCQPRVLHFDFGAQLRAAVARDGGDGLAPPDVAYLRRVLEEGALLEDETFYIAERLFDAFGARHDVAADDIVLMNGLPRHVDQARKLAGRLDMRTVLALRCDEATVLQRLRLDTGGDRGARTDDEPALVRRKLATYHARTMPLIAWYRQRGAKVIDIRVNPATTAEELIESSLDLDKL